MGEKNQGAVDDESAAATSFCDRKMEGVVYGD